MFGFLKRLNPFRRRYRDDVYDPGERLIFSFYNGEKLVRADPMSLYKQVMARGPELAVDMKVANSPMKDAPKAHDAMLSKIREAFGVKAFEDGGLTQQETVDLLDRFMEFCDRLKKNSSPTPTPAEATPPPSPSSSGGGSPTASSSPSGSTANAPSTAPPAPSPTASPSPSASLTRE